jgi:diguanylate cyclase (GGDEF)-like protein/PAS domain S-box-containing protein
MDPRSRYGTATEGDTVNGKDARALRLATARPLEHDDGPEVDHDLVAAVDVAPDPVALVTAEGGLVRWNAAWQRELGHTPGALDAATVVALVHEHERSAVARAVRRVATRASSGEATEARVRLGDGSHRWYDWTVRPHASRPWAFIWGRDISARHRDEAEVRTRLERLERLVDASPVGLFEMDAEGTVVDANSRWAELTGHAVDAARGRHWSELTDDAGSAALRSALASWPSGEASATFALRGADGSEHPARLRLTARRAPDGTLEGYVGSLEDGSDPLVGDDASASLRAIVEATPDVVLVWDDGGRVRFANQAAAALLGVDAATEVVTLDRVYPAWACQRIEEVGPELRRRGAWSGELAMLDADGREVPVSQVLVLHEAGDGGRHVSAVARDISEHKAREEELAYRATHDALTGLPNRVLFLERLRAALQRTRTGVASGTRSVAVIFLDLDRFKLINDSLGHDVGDQLLTELAARLQDLLRPVDLVARLAGDEFVVLCEGVEGERDALRLADRILEAVSHPFALASGEVFVSTSIGVAVGSDLEPEALMENADVAMYRAKDRGRARCELFDAELRNGAAARLELETALRQAVERDELRVFYQPVFSLRTGDLTAVEALVRWQHPVQGLVGPAEFIPVAEESGLILPIGAWVLEEACRQARRWEAEHPGSAALGVHVNLSARQFAQPDLAQQVARVVEAAGVDPARLCLEITESVVMDDVEATIAALLELRALGVKVGIDDFGTGYSSLSYLKRLPVDVLKIDKSFVAKLGEDMVDSAIVSSVVNLARSLGIAVVAEGVETEQQRLELRALGCPVAQGYYFSRPLSADAATDLIATESWQ